MSSYSLEPQMEDYFHLFDRIKKYVEQGNDINSFCQVDSDIHDPTMPTLSIFLEHYYAWLDRDVSPDEIDDCIADELFQPLAKRTSEILSMVEWLISHGADVNAAEYAPMEYSVHELDYSMTEYLLAHGADPHFGEDNTRFPPERNYYLEDLDVNLLNHGAFTDCTIAYYTRVELVKKIASLFAAHGVTSACAPSTICLYIDEETHEVTVERPHLRY